MSSEYPTESIQFMSFVNSWFKQLFWQGINCSRPVYFLPFPVPCSCSVSAGSGTCCCDAQLLTKPKALLPGANCSQIALAVLLLRHFVAFVGIDLLLEMLEPNISFHENVQEKNLFRNDKLQNYSLTICL